MEIWSRCDICGRDIPVGELCYGLKKGNCICKNCCTGFENCTFTLAPMPTLTPPNEWVSRVQELDELYTKLQIVTGFTAEKLLEMFAAGYTLKKPDYSKHFEAMANLAESDPPNEPLTLEPDEIIELKGRMEGLEK